MSDEGGGQAKGGKNEFDVWSADEPTSEKPRNGPPPVANSPYEWTDVLSEGAPNGDPIGTAVFSGTMQDTQRLTCTGTITLTGGSGWIGTVSLSGILHLKEGKVGEGHLDVDDGQNVAFRRVRVTKENPKRYKTV